MAVVVCVLLSVLLWFFFSMRRTTGLDITLPTRVVNLPPGESFVVAPPTSVAYRVRADGLSLLPLYYNRPYVEIDASAGEVNFETNASGIPSDVRIESAAPPAFFPQLEASVTVRIPVRLRADVTTAATYEFIRFPTISPDSVSVTGAGSVVSRLRSWPTVPFTRDNLRDSLDVQLPLADTLAGLVTVNRRHVMLSAVADAFTQGSRRIKVRITGAPSEIPLATLDPEIITVTYRVSVSDYTRAQNSADFSASVAYDRIRGDTTGGVIPDITLPRGLMIRDVSIEPPSLRYYNYLE